MRRASSRAVVAVVEGAVGGLLLIAGLLGGLLGVGWGPAFWLVTAGAACVGHAVTFGFGLLDGPCFWSVSREKRPRGF